MVIAPPGAEDPDADVTGGMGPDEWTTLSYGGGTADGPAPEPGGGPSRMLLAALVVVVALILGVTS